MDTPKTEKKTAMAKCHAFPVYQANVHISFPDKPSALFAKVPRCGYCHKVSGAWSKERGVNIQGVTTTAVQEKLNKDTRSSFSIEEFGANPPAKVQWIERSMQEESVEAPFDAKDDGLPF